MNYFLTRDGIQPINMGVDGLIEYLSLNNMTLVPKDPEALRESVQDYMEHPNILFRARTLFLEDLRTMYPKKRMNRINAPKCSLLQAATYAIEHGVTFVIGRIITSEKFATGVALELTQIDSNGVNHLIRPILIDEILETL